MSDPTPLNRWARVEEEDYISLSAAYSLTAEPLPPPPLPSEMPPELLQTIDGNRHLFRIICPVVRDRIMAQLVDHPNQPFVKSVGRVLSTGFHPKLGRDLKDIKLTHDGSRRIRASDKEELLKHRDTEVKAGRYSLAFGTELLPGMHALPQHVVREEGKARTVTDHTSGDYAPNSLLPKKGYSVRGDDITDFIRTLCQAKLEAGDRPLVLFKSDVSKAFRILPMHPYWQARQVVKIDGKYHVDRCNSFGGRASGLYFCAFYSLVLWIAEHKRGIRNLFAHIDDNFSYEFADNLRLYKPSGIMMPSKQAALLELWDDLGIPHEQKKQVHGPALDIVGHAIDIVAMRIDLPERTREKLLDRISTFVSFEDEDKISGYLYRSLAEFQELSGLIEWASQFHRPLRLGAVSLQALITKTSKNCKKDEQPTPQPERLRVSRAIFRELAWLVAHIKHRKASPLYSVLHKNALEVYCDATPIGIGFYCESLQRGYRQNIPFKSPFDDTVYSNAYSIVRAIEWASSVEPRRDSIRIYCKDKAAVAMFARYRPHKIEHCKILMDAVDCITANNITLRVSDDATNKDASNIASLLVRGGSSKLQGLVPRNYRSVKDWKSILDRPDV